MKYGISNKENGGFLQGAALRGCSPGSKTPSERFGGQRPLSYYLLWPQYAGCGERCPYQSYTKVFIKYLLMRYLELMHTKTFENVHRSHLLHEPHKP